jgi:hypothetical protein
MTKVTHMTQTPEDHLPPGADQQGSPRAVLDPQAMTLENAARLLSRAGGKVVPLEVLQADIDAGVPTNAHGTLNLVHYAAWLVKEMGRGD